MVKVCFLFKEPVRKWGCAKRRETCRKLRGLRPIVARQNYPARGDFYWSVLGPSKRGGGGVGASAGDPITHG